MLQGSGEEVSVFVFDVRNGNETQFDVCKAAVKRLKTLRHPSILTYLESLEVSSFQLHTYLPTYVRKELPTPLYVRLANLRVTIVEIFLPFKNSCTYLST